MPSIKVCKRCSSFWQHWPAWQTCNRTQIHRSLILESADAAAQWHLHKYSRPTQVIQKHHIRRPFIKFYNLVFQQRLQLICLLQVLEEPSVSLYTFCHPLKPAVNYTRPCWLGYLQDDTLEECSGISGILKLFSGGRNSSLVVFGLAVHSVAGSILLWGNFLVEGIFPLELTWVQTPFPPKLFQMRI